MYGMRIALCLAVALITLTPSFAQATAPSGSAACMPVDASCKPPSKSDLKKAHKLYEKAQKLQHNRKFEQALSSLDAAIALAPYVPEYVTLREMIRQQLVTNHIERGNALASENKIVEAMAQFRMALAVDPKNQYALQRLEDTVPSRTRVPTVAHASLSPALAVVSESRPPILSPTETRHDFHFKGMSRNLLEQVVSAYGIKAIFDDSVQSRPVRFDIEDVDFFTALREASKLAHAFWIPLTSKQVFFANDTQALRRDYEHMVARTFYINNATAPQDINDVVNLLRSIFDIRFVVAQPNDNSIVVRAPADILDAAAQVVESFLSRRPQVNLQIQVFQVSHLLTRALGIQLPLSFQVINVGAAAIAALGQNSSNLQSIINQIIATGSINNVNSQGLQALISQLQGQQNSLLQTPFATFGGGKTLFAIPFPGTTFNFSVNKSNFQSLSDITMRTSQNNAATLRIGSRYPILNASFAPLYNTPAISQVLQNGSYLAPFPSFTYEDLGITVKATPQVLDDDSVNLKLEMSIKTLTGQSYNNVPVISNREFMGTMSVLDGEPAVVAGMIDQSDQKSLSGIPGIGQIPGLRALTTNQTKNVTADELLIVVTPHIVSAPRQPTAEDEVWIPTT
jgi:general secretion pathway protein D